MNPLLSFVNEKKNVGISIKRIFYILLQKYSYWRILIKNQFFYKVGKKFCYCAEGNRLWYKMSIKCNLVDWHDNHKIKNFLVSCPLILLIETHCNGHTEDNHLSPVGFIKYELIKWVRVCSMYQYYWILYLVFFIHLAFIFLKSVSFSLLRQCCFKQLLQENLILSGIAKILQNK